jgi:hypothetical protein
VFEPVGPPIAAIKEATPLLTLPKALPAAFKPFGDSRLALIAAVLTLALDQSHTAARPMIPMITTEESIGAFP